MNDFLAFIEKDIATKKLTIQTLPIKTKTNIKKLNETIKIYEETYEEYQTGVRNYLLAKSRSFEISDVEDNSLKNQINEKVIEILNLSEEIVLMEDENGIDTKLNYRLRWCRTNLKQHKKIRNIKRGVWTLEE